MHRQRTAAAFGVWFCIGAALVAALGSDPVSAADVEIRFIAADREDRPPISQLEDFRRSPDGGLIATQWISSVTLGGKALFPVTGLGKTAPDAPDAVDPDRAPKKDVDDLLDDIKKSDAASATAPRPIDVIDPQYRSEKFSLGRLIGPQRSRQSMATVNLTAATLLEPTGRKLSANGKRIDVPCYPLTITAVVSGREAHRVAFTPALTWDDRDLLADFLFEHSPDLPLGDVGDRPRVADNLQDWLTATRGGQRAFQRLTIYLPENLESSTPYDLQGTKFRIGPEGVRLLQAKVPPRITLRRVQPFAVELLLPAAESREEFVIPWFSDLGPGWSVDDGAPTAGPVPANAGKATAVTSGMFSLPSNATSISLTLKSPTGQPQVLRTAFPVPAAAREQSHLLGLVTGGRSAEEPPLMHVLAWPRGSTADGKPLPLRLEGLSRLGNAKPIITAQLIAGYPATIAANSGDALAKPVLMPLVEDSPGRFNLPIDKRPSGLYTAVLTIDGRLLPAVPLVIARPETLGSITAVTWHNRNDYYRGEQLQVALIVRATKDIRLPKAHVSVHHNGGIASAGSVALDVPKGEARTLFLTVDTDRLPLGEHRLEVDAPGLISHPHQFTLHSPTPDTTFALYSWMTGSFSGPVRAGGETLVNLLFAQRPTQFLAPHEIIRYTGQPTLPVALRPLLDADPLYPASEKTALYDESTEREMAAAMRLGLRYAPEYGWGLNDQEAAWNPKHTLPENLARIRRLCSLVAQRLRDFGNYAGLHLNWYPTLGGYWENHPPTDGDVARRAKRLAQETELVTAAVTEQKANKANADASAELELGVQRHKYRIAALPRAYREWTERTSQLLPGLTDHPLSDDVEQPGLSPQRPAATSFLPISWFDQRSYYPSVYFSTLPAATVHAYTDYGFSPFQPQWGLDFWAAGVGKKPRWVTTMSNGRDIMLGQALLLAGRGASGIDINGDDPQTARVLSRFLKAYGPMLRKMSPESDVAIVTSLRQQLLDDKLVGRWMGYTGGNYYDLYTKLWYARRPAAMLLDEELTPERLANFKAVFLVHQQAPLPEPAMQALNAYAKSGGRVFKDAATAATYPGELYSIAPGKSIGPAWDGTRYVATRDQMFVGVQAAYEASAKSLDKILSELPAPRVASDSHQTLLATLAGRETAVVMAVNDTRTPPGIYHPWNFWSATILAAEGRLSFDQPYCVYDLLEGGRLETPGADSKDRFSLPVAFDRASARALVLTKAPLKELKLSTTVDGSGMQLTVAAEIIDERGETLPDAWPLEISLESGKSARGDTIFRALAPQETISLALPSATTDGTWTLTVRELVSGLTATRKITVAPQKLLVSASSATLIARPADVRQFLANPATDGRQSKTPATKSANGFDPLRVMPLDAPEDSELPAASADTIVILLDQPQMARLGKPLVELAESLVASLEKRGRPARVVVQDPLELVEIPLRWQPTSRDREYVAEVAAGRRIAVAAGLNTRHFQTEKDRNKPDFLHPYSGYGEPATRSRIGEHVILLGHADDNRYLQELHAAVGMRATEHVPSRGGALVQVVFDAFVPDRHALTIQAHDLAGLRHGIDSVLKLPQTAPKPTEQKPAAPGKTDVVKSSTRTSLPNPLQETFGSAVTPIAFTAEGGLLASADLQSNNYFQFGGDGALQRQWLGKYGLLPAPSGEVFWTMNWWGAPGLLDKIVRCDAYAKPQWLMDAPRYSRNFQFWQHPGSATLPDRVTDDLFVAGHCRLARISPEGKTLWLYDDTPTAHDPASFRFRRDIMLHDISPDGQRLLVAAFGIEPYADFVSRIVRPSLILFDAQSGEVLWEKPDILVDHSVCRFAGPNGEQIVVGDATPDRKRLLLLDKEGDEVWSLSRPQGTSAAVLTADGSKLIVRPEAPRGTNRQILGEPQGLQVIDRAKRTTTDLPLPAGVTSWHWFSKAAKLLITTSEGQLLQTSLDGTLDWEREFSGTPNVVVAADERQFAVGTPDGHLRWLDAEGKVLRDIDLMPHNRVTDMERYVKQYTQTPGDIPVVEPTPAPPPTIDERGRDVVTFSPNALDDSALTRLTEGPLLKPVTLQVPQTPGRTHVLSLVQRTSRDQADSALLTVEVKATGEKSLLYRAELQLSSTWEERTVAWKTPAGVDEVELLLSVKAIERPATPGTVSAKLPIEIRRAGVFAVTFPSLNLLTQKGPQAAEAPLDNASEPQTTIPKGSAAAPALKYFIPNDVDLAARARGAPPFQRTVEFTTPFDGKISNEPTSWLGKPLGGSTHATLEIKLPAPTTLGSLAIYEDATSAAHYTDTFALFIRDAKTGQWQQAGSVVGNRSPFNLFTFPATEIDTITYLWLKSPDGHARIMELEGYLAEEDLID